MITAKSSAVLNYDTAGAGSNDSLTLILYGIVLVGFVVIVSMMFWN